MTTIDWSKIEDRIRPHVKLLRDAGYNTVGSCGHEMYIEIDMPPLGVAGLDSFLHDNGYVDFEIACRRSRAGQTGYSTIVKFGGDLAADGRPFDLVLLKVESTHYPLYFVVKARRWPDHARRLPDQDAYYYNEHTCPTNWTDEILAVIWDGDTDPHGFARFVRRIEAPPGMNESGDMGEGDEASWLELFPEANPFLRGAKP